MTEKRLKDAFGETPLSVRQLTQSVRVAAGTLSFTGSASPPTINEAKGSAPCSAATYTRVGCGAVKLQATEAVVFQPNEEGTLISANFPASSAGPGVGASSAHPAKLSAAAAKRRIFFIIQKVGSSDKSVAGTKVAYIFNSAKFSNKKARNFMEICQKLRHNTPDFAQRSYVYRRSLLSLWL